MSKERTILRIEKARFKEQLASLKHYLRELKGQCADCGTAHEHVSPDVMKAEHDAQFYESRIKEISSRIKTLNLAVKKKK